MARSLRSTRLENRTKRLTLPQGTREFLNLGFGLSLGYRRAKGNFGAWQARVRHEEQYFFKTLGMADDFQEANGADVLDFFQAQRKAAEFFDAVTKGRVGKAEDFTVSEACESYLKWFRENRKGVRETEGYVKVHIEPFLGNRKVSELTSPGIRKWLEKIASTPARRRTSRFEKQKFKHTPQTEEERRARRASSNRILTALKAALNKAYHDGLVSDDSGWRRVKPFSKVDQPRVRFLTDTEAVRLINACPPELRALVNGALVSGCRYSELPSLRVGDVNLRTAHLYIAPGKSALSRHVPLNEEGVQFFRSMLAGKTADALVFSLNGHTWGKSHHLKPLIRACKVAKLNPPVRFHELRHTYASHLAQSGVDLLTISKLLGHRDTRITSRVYSHLSDESLRKAVAKLPSLQEGRREILQEVEAQG